MNKYRTELSAIISTISPLDGRESFDMRWAQDWVASDAPLFRGEVASLPDPHLVTYGVPVDLATQSFFLIQHAKSGLMLPPGGHVDPMELPDRTVSREIREELGTAACFDTPLGNQPLFITATSTKAVPGIASHTDMTLWYVLSLGRDEALNFLEPQVPGGAWHTLQEAQAILSTGTDAELGRFIAKLRAALGW